MADQLFQVVGLRAMVQAGQHLDVGQRFLHVQRHQRPFDGPAQMQDFLGSARRLTDLAPDLFYMGPRRPIQNQSERPFLRVPNQQHDRVQKIRIEQFANVSN